MNKDRLQSTKMYDEILDQNSDCFLIFFFRRNKSNFDEFGLTKVNDIAAVKSCHILYNTIIGIQLPKWMLDAEIHLPQSTNVWIILDQICQLWACASDTLGHLELCFFYPAHFCIHCKDLLESGGNSNSDFLPFICEMILEVIAQGIEMGGRVHFLWMSKVWTSFFQKVQVGKCKSHEG